MTNNAYSKTWQPKEQLTLNPTTLNVACVGILASLISFFNAKSANSDLNTDTAAISTQSQSLLEPAIGVWVKERTPKRSQPIHQTLPHLLGTMMMRGGTSESGMVITTVLKILDRWRRKWKGVFFISKFRNPLRNQSHQSHHDHHQHPILHRNLRWFWYRPGRGLSPMVPWKRDWGGLGQKTSQEVVPQNRSSGIRWEGTSFWMKFLVKIILKKW